MIETEKFDDKFNILIIVPIENLQNSICEAIKQFPDIPLIYVTLNKPYKTVKKTLEDHKCKQESIYFVDCISSKGQEKNVIFAESPSALTTISIAITQISEKIKGDRLLLIDSLSTFLIYNEINTLARFINSIIQKNQNKLIIFTPKEQDRTLIEKVGPFFDEITEL